MLGSATLSLQIPELEVAVGVFKTEDESLDLEVEESKKESEKNTKDTKDTKVTVKAKKWPVRVAWKTKAGLPKSSSAKSLVSKLDNDQKAMAACLTLCILW